MITAAELQAADEHKQAQVRARAIPHVNELVRLLEKLTGALDHDDDAFEYAIGAGVDQDVVEARDLVARIIGWRT